MGSLIDTPVHPYVDNEPIVLVRVLAWLGANIAMWSVMHPHSTRQSTWRRMDKLNSESQSLETYVRSDL